jgi:hypothetical protein
MLVRSNTVAMLLATAAVCLGAAGTAPAADWPQETASSARRLHVHRLALGPKDMVVCGTHVAIPPISPRLYPAGRNIPGS